jgi:hypothetical protein
LLNRNNTTLAMGKGILQTVESEFIIFYLIVVFFACIQTNFNIIAPLKFAYTKIREQ